MQGEVLRLCRSRKARRVRKGGLEVLTSDHTPKISRGGILVAAGAERVKELDRELIEEQKQTNLRDT